MEPRIHNEPNHEPCPYLQYSESTDSFLSESGSPLLSYLRIELARIRPGMTDFLIRIATPRLEAKSKNTIVTLRGTRNMAKFEGVLGTAKVLFREMEKRGDKYHEWSKADPEHFARMIAIPFKTFTLNTNLELLRFSSEALK